MGRRKSQKQAREQVAESLVAHGVPRGFALKVAEVYAEKGASDALVLLYAGGWELYIEWRDDYPREKVLQLRRCMSA